MLRPSSFAASVFWRQRPPSDAIYLRITPTQRLTFPQQEVKAAQPLSAAPFMCLASTECLSLQTGSGHKKSFSTVLFIHTSDYLRYLRTKQTVIHLPTPPENVTTPTSEMQNFFIWLKVCWVLSSAGGSEENQLWAVIGGTEKNWLWCVATGMSCEQRYSKCSEWPPSALIHASSLSRH